MTAGGGENRDCIDVLIGQEIRVCFVPARDAEVVGEGLGDVVVSICYGDEFGVRHAVGEVDRVDTP
jgi:proline racemase